MKSVLLLTLFCSVAFGAVLPAIPEMLQKLQTDVTHIIDMMHNMMDRQRSGVHIHVHGPEGAHDNHTHGNHIHVHMDPHGGHHGHFKEAHCDMTPNKEIRKRLHISGHIHMRQPRTM